MRQQITPDKQKAFFLKENAMLTLERLNKTEKLKYPTYTVIDYYTSIQYLLEHLCFLKGIKILGEGKHRELIIIAREEKAINQQEEWFLQQLREKRNRIQYEGEQLNKEFLEEYEEKIMHIIKKLTKYN